MDIATIYARADDATGPRECHFKITPQSIHGHDLVAVLAALMVREMKLHANVCYFESNDVQKLRVFRKAGGSAHQNAVL